MSTLDENMKIGEILLIKWLDSASYSGWNKPSDLLLRPHWCQTVGFFIHEDDESLTVAQNKCDEEGAMPYGEFMTIPKVVIQHKLRFEEPSVEVKP